jgi:hypothetical protein
LRLDHIPPHKGLWPASYMSEKENSEGALLKRFSDNWMRRLSAVLVIDALVALAVPHDLAVVESSNGLGGIVAEDAGDGVDLEVIHALRGLVEEPADGFGASAPGERTVVGVVLAAERLVELLEVDEAVPQDLSVGRSARSINVLEETVEEATATLLVEEDRGDDEVVVALGAELLVGDLKFSRIALAVDGVVSGEAEGNGLYIVAVSVARVAATNSDETKSAGNGGSDLNSATLLLNGAVAGGPVVTAELEGNSIREAGTNAFRLVVMRDVDRALLETRLTEVHGGGGAGGGSVSSHGLSAREGERNQQ